MTEVDVYLDVGWAASKPDYRFDWASAINDNTGIHRRDFAFNVGTSTRRARGVRREREYQLDTGQRVPAEPVPEPARPHRTTAVCR